MNMQKLNKFHKENMNKDNIKSNLEIEKRGYLNTNEKALLIKFLDKNALFKSTKKQLNIFCSINNDYFSEKTKIKSSLSIVIEEDIISKEIKMFLKSKFGNVEDLKREEVSINLEKTSPLEIFKFLRSLGIEEGCPRYYLRKDYTYNNLNVTIKENGLVPDHFEVELIKGNNVDDIDQFINKNKLNCFSSSQYKQLLKELLINNPPVLLNEIKFKDYFN